MCAGAPNRLAQLGGSLLHALLEFMVRALDLLLLSPRHHTDHDGRHQHEQRGGRHRDREDGPAQGNGFAGDGIEVRVDDDSPGALVMGMRWINSSRVTPSAASLKASVSLPDSHSENGSFR